MAKTKGPRRGKPKDTGRRGKKKVSILTAEQNEYLDYKDVDVLRRFMSDRAKIRGSRVNGNNAQQQRIVANAIKNAREMALLPYTSRVTTQRRSRNDRSDRRPPRGDEGRPSSSEVPIPETTPPAPTEEAVVPSEGEI